MSASQSCCAHDVDVSFTPLLRTRRGCQLHSPAAHTPCDESYKATNNISDYVDDVEKGGEGEGEDAQRRKSNNPNLKGGEQGKATEHFHKSSKRHHHCRRSLFNSLKNAALVSLDEGTKAKPVVKHAHAVCENL